MSEDRSYSEVTHESWSSGVGKAYKAVLIGLALFFSSFLVLFFNEARALATYNALNEGSKAVLSVSSDKVDSANSGKLVHVSGMADTEELLTDPEFGVSVKAIKLRRIVEMYQWSEKTRSNKEKKSGGGTRTVKTYSYSKMWSENAINSSSFRQPESHQNPGSIPYKSVEQVAQKVSLGAFSLSPSLIAKIDNYQPYRVSKDSSVPQLVQGKVSLRDGGYYIGDSPSSPKIGDVRINFKVANPTNLSLVARQVDSSFEPYTTKSGRNIELMQTGNHSAEEMFTKAHEGNVFMTWIMRLVGFILMFVGLTLLFGPLSAMAEILPIFGDIVRAGTELIAFLLAAVLSLMTIAFAWVFFRPVIAGIVFVVAIGVSIPVIGKLRSAKAAR